MRKLLLIWAMLLTSCSNCKQTDPTPPEVPTVTTSDIESLQSTSTATFSELNPTQVVDWKTQEELLYTSISNPDICAMVYFPDIIEGTKDIETSLMDPRVVEIINANFVAMEFVLTEDNLNSAMDKFQIDSLPTLIFAPSSGSIVLHVRGNPSPDELLAELKEITAKGAPFENCASVKAKTN